MIESTAVASKKSATAVVVYFLKLLLTINSLLPAV